MSDYTTADSNYKDNLYAIAYNAPERPPDESERLTSKGE